MVYSDTVEGIPKPELSIVLFADILGFKQQLLNAFESQAGGEFLARVRTAVHEATEPFRERGDRCAYSIFSNSVIVGWPLRSKVRVFHIAEDGTSKDYVAIMGQGDAIGILHPLGKFAHRMMSAGFLLRGAITVDMHFMSDSLVGGPALVHAVKREQDRLPEGRRPRLVLDKSFIGMLNGISHPSAANVLARYNCGEWLNTTIYGVGCDQPGDPRTTEGPRSYFLDYLELLLLATAGDNDHVAVARFLQHHRGLIETGLDLGGAQLRDKHVWLRDYHNAFCCLRPSYGFAKYAL